ncbi:serine hydrolase [Flavobacterium sp. CLA17]|uniref:serine hydrolase domain-containing protein n=1 Tax=Flavobacterium sp. CLA17 TaxID=2724135 RepID=UPI001491839F|nr:serine hydrolase [Flavobacterium sp. CLA17]QSB29047.1 serine hydrolase [Flavobacterium sp. CLA17]
MQIVKNKNTIRQFGLLTTIFLTTCSLFGQKADFVKSDKITYPVHKANVGKIAFMRENIPIEKFTQSDFLTTYELKDKSNLDIRFFLKNSLTNSLHVLSPNSSAEELIKNGNYQFSFFMDGKKVYVENLNNNAGSKESKNKKKMVRVPLISAANEDSWGKFLWNRFLANGGQEALTDGEHLLKIEIRPYLNTTEVLTGEIIAEGEIKIIVPQIIIDEKLVKVQNIEQLTDWQVSTEKIDNVKLEELNRKILTNAYKNITSVVVIKDGKLLIEEYFNEENRNSLHDTRSVGKSFASTLMGIAIKGGYIKSEAQTLKDFYNLSTFQNYSPSKDSITLQSLLTMSSAFDGSDMNQESPGNEEKMYTAENWVDFTLNLSIDKTKTAKKRWDYFTAGVVLLGDIIHKSVPNGLEKYADEKLFQPLGITDYKWQLTPQKVANTAGSLQLRSLDYAKYGQLYQNKGSWNGKQILSQEWVTKSLSRQMEIGEGEYYGYLFWNKTYKIKDVEYEVCYSSGNGGNRIFIFKDKPIVIVITSEAYNTPYGEKQVDKIMEEYLIPTIF